MEERGAALAAELVEEVTSSIGSLEMRSWAEMSELAQEQPHNQTPPPPLSPATDAKRKPVQPLKDEIAVNSLDVNGLNISTTGPMLTSAASPNPPIAVAPPLLGATPTPSKAANPWDSQTKQYTRLKGDLLFSLFTPEEMKVLRRKWRRSNSWVPSWATMERELNKLGRRVPQQIREEALAAAALGLVDLSTRRAGVKGKSKEEDGTSAGGSAMEVEHGIEDGLGVRGATEGGTSSLNNAQVSTRAIANAVSASTVSSGTQGGGSGLYPTRDSFAGPPPMPAASSSTTPKVSSQVTRGLKADLLLPYFSDAELNVLRRRLRKGKSLVPSWDTAERELNRLGRPVPQELKDKALADAERAAGNSSMKKGTMQTKKNRSIKEGCQDMLAGGDMSLRRNNQIIGTYPDGAGQSGPFYYEQTNHHHSMVKSIYTSLYKDSLVPQPTGPHLRPPPFLYPFSDGPAAVSVNTQLPVYSDEHLNQSQPYPIHGNILHSSPSEMLQAASAPYIDTVDRNGSISATPGDYMYDLPAAAVPVLAQAEQSLATETPPSAYPHTCDHGAFTLLTPFRTKLYMMSYMEQLQDLFTNLATYENPLVPELQTFVLAFAPDFVFPKPPNLYAVGLSFWPESVQDVIVFIRTHFDASRLMTNSPVDVLVRHLGDWIVRCFQAVDGYRYRHLETICDRGGLWKRVYVCRNCISNAFDPELEKFQCEGMLMVVWHKRRFEVQWKHLSVHGKYELSLVSAQESQHGSADAAGSSYFAPPAIAATSPTTQYDAPEHPFDPFDPDLEL